MAEPDKFNIDFNTLRRPAAALAASGALLLAACGVENKEVSAHPAAYTTASTAVETNPKLIFDDLRTGQHYVRVYGSPFTPPKKGSSSEYFLDRDRVEVACSTLGRLVRSNPDRGERRRSSREWFRILTTGHKTWASAVYVRNLRELRADPRVEDC